MSPVIRVISIVIISKVITSIVIESLLKENNCHLFWLALHWKKAWMHYTTYISMVYLKMTKNERHECTLLCIYLWFIKTNYWQMLPFSLSLIGHRQKTWMHHTIYIYGLFIKLMTAAAVLFRLMVKVMFALQHV